MKCPYPIGYQIIAVSTYTVVLGLFALFTLVAPFFLFSQLLNVALYGEDVLLGQDLFVLPLCILSVYYLCKGQVMGYLLRDKLWFRPLMVLALVSLICLMLAMQFCHAISIRGGSSAVAAIVGLIFWRLVVSAFFIKYPVYTFNAQSIVKIK